MGKERRALAAPSYQTGNTANLIVNGSFEADPFTDSGVGFELGLVGNEVTGWFIPNSDGTYPWGLQNANAFGGGPAAEGNQWIVLGLWNTGFEYSIQQTVTGLTPGQYHLSFAISSERDCCAMAEVSFLDGSLTPAQIFTAPSSGDFWTEWGTHEMDFLATGDSVTIQFKQHLPSSAGLDLGLDNVQMVSAVPIPAALPLMGSALAVLGLLRRKRSA